MNFTNLKGIIGDLGVKKITLKLNAKPLEKTPYHLNLKYKERVYLELDKMPTIDLRKLNDSCVHDPFPTLFADEVLDSVGSQEAYSFTDGFSRYHQIKIAPEDRSKMTFAAEWGCFQYTVMPFGLKNALAIFSRVVISAFKDFIHKFLEVYFYDWTVFGLVKRHVASLRLMLDTCRRYQIAFN
eukprot:PITA_27142